MASKDFKGLQVRPLQNEVIKQQAEETRLLWASFAPNNVRWKSCTAPTSLLLSPATMLLSACRGVLPLAAVTLLLLVCLAPDGSRGNKLKLMLQKHEALAPVKIEVSVKENTAKEFLSSLKRQKRQLWDRTQPDVQQWYQQFLYLGFDETKFEDDISYWTNLGRGGNEYYGGYYQHHYDEDAAIGPRNPHTFRHGASVNYDDY